MNGNLLNARQVSEKLAISRATVYRLIATGEIRGVRIRERCVRVTPEDLADFIASNLATSRLDSSPNSPLPQ